MSTCAQAVTRRAPVMLNVLCRLARTTRTVPPLTHRMLQGAVLVFLAQTLTSETLTGAQCQNPSRGAWGLA